jgi:hypothetical protein
MPSYHEQQSIHAAVTINTTINQSINIHIQHHPNSKTRILDVSCQNSIPDTWDCRKTGRFAQPHQFQVIQSKVRVFSLFLQACMRLYSVCV